MQHARGDGPPVRSPAFVRRLGEAGYGPERGSIGVLDLLARSGLPVPEGFVLTAEGHGEFLKSSGLEAEILSRARGRGAVASGTRSLGETLEQELRAALLGLGARTVVVWSRRRLRRGLGTIPAVVAAVREAWASTVALERQISASANGDIPTWPVLVQRQARPGYTGWTSTADLRPGPPGRVVRGDVPLHEVEPTGGREGVARLTRRAATVLEGAVRLDWAFEDGRWLLVSAEEEPEQPR